MKKSRISKENKKLIVISMIPIALLLVGLLVALFLGSASQDIRQQASGCSENPVNVEFRKYTGKDEPGWKDGVKFKNVEVGDKFDVNCFARNGSALLSAGKFTVKLGGKQTSIPSSAFKTSTEVRGWQIDKPGAWAFTCSNSKGCSNTDTITVIGKTPKKVACYTYNDKKEVCTKTKAIYEKCNTNKGRYPTLKKCSKANSNEASGNDCDTAYQADINQDCQVDLLDYDLFLKDFRAYYSE
ncbi:MAG: hypothetical protein ABFQ62_00580 [Patescibacteria group bacterium]